MRKGAQVPAKWSDLSKRQRTLLAAAATAEATLKIAALVDIDRRPADQIRGPKIAWRLAMVVNFIGPVSYFAFGRKRYVCPPGPTGPH
jgi:Phospholipase_D-nuclease N-terminal